MITKKMNNLIENGSLIREMFLEGARLKKIFGEDNVFDFSIGNPNVESPKELKDSIVKHTLENKKNLHSYMNNAGFDDVREKIANSINKKEKTNYNEKNIVMTVGAAGGLNVILKTILETNDEVIVLSPYFGEYKNYIENFNGKIVEISADTKNFQINFEELKEKITKNTKAIIVNSPNNPTGVIYSKQTIIQLSTILNDKTKEYGSEICLISDEPYRELIYTNISIPFIPNFYKNTVVVYSYSKSLSVPGERIGYIVIPTNFDGFEKFIQGLSVSNRILGFVNAPSLFQKVIGDCLEIKVNMEIYKNNLNILYYSLTNIGFDCIKPDGAFYLFPKSPIDDDIEFCKKAKEYNILIVPGSFFNCPGYFRVSYCCTTKTAENSIPYFEKLFELYK